MNTSASSLSDTICLLLDSSGSMEVIKDKTIESFNNFITEQKSQLGSELSTFTLVTFSSRAKIVLDKVALSDTPLLTADKYKPDGSTALFDAIRFVITRLEGQSNVIIGIMTDGEENSSENPDLNSLHRLISSKTDLGWKFIFLGANQDSFKTGTSMGISMNSSFRADNVGVADAYRCLSREVTNCRNLNRVNTETKRPPTLSVPTSELVRDQYVTPLSTVAYQGPVALFRDPFLSLSSPPSLTISSSTTPPPSASSSSFSILPPFPPVPILTSTPPPDNLSLIPPSLTTTLSSTPVFPNNYHSLSPPQLKRDPN